MTDADFLQEILAHPDDDAPRLIYADWLEERGDPRGEFIRVQMALSQLADHDPQRGKLLPRERKLLKAHGSKWAELLPSGLSSWVFRRGFIEHVEVSVDVFVKDGEDIFAKTPLRSVRLRPIAGLPDVRPLLESPLLARLRGLAFRPAGYDEATRQQQPGFNDPCVAMLLLSPYLPVLEDLEIPGNHLTDRGLTALAQNKKLASLARLNLSNNQLGAEGIGALMKSVSLKGLRKLVLSGNALGLAGSQALAGSINARQLTHLDLSRCNLGTRGLQALCAGNFDNLTDLDVSSNRIGVLAGATLANAPFLARLQRLNLGRNRLEDRGVAALAESPLLQNVVELDLRRNRCGQAAAEAIAAASMPQLVELDLRNNRVGALGVRALKDSKTLERLTRLDARNNGIGAEEKESLRAHLGRSFGRL